MPSDTKTVTFIQSFREPVVDEPHAPFIFFDNAPAYGHDGQIVNIALTASRFIPRGQDVDLRPVVVAQLRCSRNAAIDLREALTSALKGMDLDAAVTEGGSN